MDKKIIIQRIDELMEEKRISKYALKENTEISSTIYQWRKNTARDATRTPSLRSIERVCEFLGVSLSYFLLLKKKNKKG
ncbi:MAG: helix-turn-helix domain-containing protein [Christensenellaceae bacterium]